MSEAEAPACFLCGRALGTKFEWHRPVPRSRGGRGALDTKALARDYASAALRSHPEPARFIARVELKDPDLHVPTGRGRR